MKKLVLCFLFSFSMVFVLAQQNYKTVLTELMKSSETDFLNITGPKILETDEGISYYETKLKLGIGTEHLEKSPNSKGAVYVLTCEYLKAKNLEKAIEEFGKSYFHAPKYEIEVAKDEKTDVTTIEVYEKDAPTPFFTSSIEITAKDVTKFVFRIYSKSIPRY